MKGPKTKWWQTWVDVKYGKQPMPIPFDKWSNLIKGEGDEDLPSSKGMSRFGRWMWKWSWKKLIVLEPIGPPDALFKVGYWNKELGICQISFNSERYVSDGPFAMRMGPEDCYFFVLATGPVELNPLGYFTRDMYIFKKYPKIVLY